MRTRAQKIGVLLRVGPLAMGRLLSAQACSKPSDQLQPRARANGLSLLQRRRSATATAPLASASFLAMPASAAHALVPIVACAASIANRIQYHCREALVPRTRPLALASGIGIRISAARALIVANVESIVHRRQKSPRQHRRRSGWTTTTRNVGQTRKRGAPTTERMCVHGAASMVASQCIVAKKIGGTPPCTIAMAQTSRP